MRLDTAESGDGATQPPLWDIDGHTLTTSEGDEVKASIEALLNEAQADRQARWEGRLLRSKALREELRLARAAGKAARHADRLRRIAAATGEE